VQYLDESTIDNIENFGNEEIDDIKSGISNTERMLGLEGM
jgi:hypothetical protein